jgi:hypothetical protein
VTFTTFGRDAGNQTENMFSVRTDAVHREHSRKVVGPALSPGKIAACEPVVSKNVSILLSRLAEAQPRSDGAVVNITSYIPRYTFDTIVEIITVSLFMLSTIHLHSEISGCPHWIQGYDQIGMGHCAPSLVRVVYVGSSDGESDEVSHV